MKQRSFMLDEIISAILLSAMCIISFLNVVSRFIFHYSFAFTEEICINLFVYLVVLGIGIAWQKKAHPSFFTVTKMLPDTIQRYLSMTGTLLTAVLLIIINIFIMQMIKDEIFLFKSTSSGLGIAKWFYYVPVPFCTILSFKRILPSIKNHKP